MNRPVSRKRPWVAAVLGAVAMGLGHIYLRRWRRAIGWFAVFFGVSFLFVDPAALAAVARGSAADPTALAPVFVVGSLSVADAYLLARARNATVRPVSVPEERPTRCPNCGDELDADLDFCHWCAADVSGSDATSSHDRDGKR
ncbi:zinc ribbon domain-containing protein [Salinirussus salinus]|jgi:hypothetical protein|uniref:zinc ribbon domain-containing protein n=1 Tax=Salinirussus salinus TaxID=1198300 RepID=UPI001357CC4D|nr:zinc ribbon domain-containing protein [Salinirussus salinus]